MLGGGDRKIRFDGKQVGEGASLLFGKLAAKTIRLHDRLTLRLRHLAQVAKGTGDQPAAFWGQAAKLLHGPADLLSLREAQPLHRLRAIDHAAALLRSHIMKLRQPVQHALLSLRSKLAKARFAFEGMLELRKR